MQQSKIKKSTESVDEPKGVTNRVMRNTISVLKWLSGKHYLQCVCINLESSSWIVGVIQVIHVTWGIMNTLSLKIDLWISVYSSAHITTHGSYRQNKASSILMKHMNVNV